MGYIQIKLQLLAVVHQEMLEKEGTESRSYAAAEGVEDKEALEATAVVCKLADLVHDQVDKLLANRIVTTCIYEHTHSLVGTTTTWVRPRQTVVHSIFLPCDHTLKVEQHMHQASLDLIDNAWLYIE